MKRELGLVNAEHLRVPPLPHHVDHVIRSYLVAELHDIEEGGFVLDGVGTLTKVRVVDGWIDLVKVSASHVLMVDIKKSEWSPS